MKIPLFPRRSTFDERQKYEKSDYFYYFSKKVQKNLRNSEKNTTFAPAKSLKGLSTVDFGALDERFSLRSAKPARAVRLRHAPQRKRDSIGSLFRFVFVLP